MQKKIKIEISYSLGFTFNRVSTVLAGISFAAKYRCTYRMKRKRK